MALQMGRPESASQTMVVSRWFVSPMATISPSPTLATASDSTERTESQIFIAFCSTQP